MKNTIEEKHKKWSASSIKFVENAEEIMMFYLERKSSLSITKESFSQLKLLCDSLLGLDLLQYPEIKKIKEFRNDFKKKSELIKDFLNE